MATVSDALHLCFVKARRKQTELAARWNTSRQAISNKFYRDYWSADELVDLGKFFGAKLVYRFPDGMEIPVTTNVQPRASVEKPQRQPVQADLEPAKDPWEDR